jgi:hypothetical protein
VENNRFMEAFAVLNVPLAGSMVPGPLGLVHLPRMWQKVSLSTLGMLPGDYNVVTRGFDVRIMDELGLDPEMFVPFLKTFPSYLATEDWVRVHSTKLDAIEGTNAAILGREMSEENAGKLRVAIGLEDPAFANGARLNNLDDAASLHAYVLANRGKLEPVIPAMSSLATGPLGLLHLPRLWAKAIIKAAGALPEGYNSGRGPLDENFAEAIGMDLGAAVAYVNAEMPSYLAFEGWVRGNAGKLDSFSMTAWNDWMRHREKPEAIAAPERAMVGIGDATMRRSTLLNDLVDWHLWHEQVAARGVSSRV